MRDKVRFARRKGRASIDSTRKTVGYLLILVSACFGSTGQPGETRGNDQVAGHRVLRVYDRGGSQSLGRGIDAIFQDRKGLYWIGTFLGLDQYDETRDEWASNSPDKSRLLDSAVRMIVEGLDSRLLAIGSGTSPRGKSNVYVFDGDRWSQDARLVPHLKHGVRAVFSDRDGELWFANQDKLLKQDGQRWTTFRPPLEMLCFVQSGIQDREGYIWLGTSKAIVRFDPDKQEWRKYPLSPLSFVTSIYEDRQGRIWFSDKEGNCYVHDKGRNSWTHHNLLDRLPPGPAPPSGKRTLSRTLAFMRIGVNAIYQDTAGQIMFATDRGLLTFLESENRWELFTPENSGLPSERILCITESRDGRIWMGTGNGIVVLDR